MRELLQEVGCDLQGKARFAAASSASEGEQTGSQEQPSNRGYLAFAADKPVHLERQIVRRGVEVLRHCSIYHGMPPSSYSAMGYVEPCTGLAQAGGRVGTRQSQPNGSF